MHYRVVAAFLLSPRCSNVAPTSQLAEEEIFGPVLVVSSFEMEADAIQIANSTMYGLGRMSGPRAYPPPCELEGNQI